MKKYQITTFVLIAFTIIAAVPVEANEARAVFVEDRKEIFSIKVENVFNKIEFAVSQLDIISEKVNSRINKILEEDKTRNLTDAKNKLAEAKQKISETKDVINNKKIELNVSLNLGEEIVFSSIKETVEIVSQNIQIIRSSLTEIINSIK